MAKKEIIHPSAFGQLPVPLSPGTRFGSLVFVSGQMGRNLQTGEMGKDVREQTRNSIERIKAVLEEAGTSLDNVMSVTLFVKNKGDTGAINEEYAKYFPANRPARAAMEVTLMGAEALVEIMATACIPE